MPRLRTLVARTALVGLAFTAFRAQGASPPVTVSLRSSFIASDPLLEALECIAMEDSSVLFPLLSAFPLPEALHKPRDAHTAVFDLASTLLDPASLASARARLALHAASPRLAASAEHYDLRVAGILDHVALECASWVDWYGQVVCDAENLLRLANAPTTEDIGTKPRRLPFDHTHTLRLSLDEPLYTVIHYADPTVPSFASLHTALLSLEPKVEYILRWARGAGDQKVGELSNYLSGYGVALDLKKMDYLVLDDRNQNLGNRQLDSSESDRSLEGRVETENRTPEEILSCIFESLPYTDELAEARARAGEPLSTEEVASLGVKAVQFLASVSSQPWIGSYVRQCWDSHKLEPPAIETVFRTLSTSFPLYATSLARKVQLTDEVNDEVLENWAKASPGVNMVWVNGRVLNEDQGGSGNIFGLLPTLQRERTLVKSLVQLGLTQEQAIELLMAPAHSSPELADSQAGASAKRPTTRGSAKAFAVQNSENSPQDGEERPKKSFTLAPKVAEFLDGLVDASDRQEGGNVILWLNDLEKDPRYRRFLPSLTGLLRVHAMSLFSPALRLRHNLINAVFVVDLSQLRSLSMLSNLQDNFVLHGYPVRWGFVPETGDDSFKMARLMCYLEHKYGKDMMIDFIQEVLALHGQRSQMTLSWGTVHDVFHALNVTEDFISVTSADAPVGDKSAGDDLLVRTQRYNKRLGVTAQGESGKGHVFVNGRYFPLSDNIMRQVANEAAIQLQILQEMVHIGEITDADSPVMSTFFYDLPSTMSRRNPYIFTKSGGGQGSDGQRLTIFNLAEVFSTVGFTLKDGSFVVPSKEPNSVLPLSMYIIADLDMLEGAELVSEALTFGSRSVDTRLTFVHNPATSGSVTGGGTAELLTTLIQAGTLSNISPSRLRAALVGEGEESLFDIMQNQLLASEGTDVSGLLQTMRLLVRQLGLQPGERAILVNGRLVGPFELGTEFLAEDMEMLEGFELTRRVGQIMGALDGVLDGEDVFDTQERTNLIAVASSIIYADQQPDPSEVGLFDTAPRPRSRNYRLLSGDYTKFEFGSRSTASTHIGLLLDPLSETAQRWSAVLESHSTLFPEAFIELYFNPTQHSEIPLKRFYRYNVIPALRYDESGQEIPAQVTFTALPEEPIYTLGMDVPQTWLVRPREALYDLDNIQLGMLHGEERSRGIQALFGLDYLVVEGHARELRTNSPPRGVQLQLVSAKDHSIVDDTQVVANLGYLQFKARPGKFHLEIREGRGRTIFTLDSVGAEGWDSPSVAKAGDDFTVMSFDGLTLYPRLARLPGMERKDVLDDLRRATEEPSGFVDSLVSKVSSLFKPKTLENKAPTNMGGEPEINIFTVASGLLYERFASIMILSVLHNTNSTVKFWFIENFLSPSFLEFIPHMAKEYGFRYELVTYKWPSWLRPQKEKQRVIWAYKILFLDVLFPMDLKKVIFVDADQIVRADLKELVDLDLHGAPYGYVPMGDDNYEMEGYRFWKTGYWHDFLDGRPYHISALYVVDLVRFREMAAGDILRGQYQMLSADPNSLANLDQDLPNNLQREVPIYSLHEDWLWCETWCSKDRLHRAKTIDLCQNPLTKEPKLSRARQIPEWEEYDTEIAQFAQKLASEGKIHASAATADTKILAGHGTGGLASEKLPQKADTSDMPNSHDEL